MGLYGDQFKDKVAIVTGAGGGIGAGVRRGAGARGRGGRRRRHQRRGCAEGRRRHQGRGRQRARGARRRRRSRLRPRRWPPQTLSEFGGIDYLVNNAAIFGGMKLDFLVTVDWDYYKKFMSVNMDGALLCTRAVYRKMAKRGGGAIVNQSSTAAWLYSELLRPGQGRHQRPDPAAGHRTRRAEHPHQRDRARARSTPRPTGRPRRRRWSPTSSREFRCRAWARPTI